ncbi:MAG: hypothetical protein CR982_06950 [Candidatus Cloacimonadota bacterium]|nr:MAG: hypothetical protein CR982_06950 [Candidatus Cloacimonadota bacterium]PIE80664.1 MAG: hypothetical protein CSA15_01815 [Candidatus Delongbacteria bacterium]
MFKRYAIFLFILIFSCGNDYYDTNVTITQDAADGLDLKAVMALVQKVKSSEELEKRLNTPGSINNLDLNEDGNVDYIKVSEYGGSGEYGFSLTTEPVKGEVQEIATIEITKDGDRANVNARGNSQIYGNNYYYHDNSHFWRNMFLFSYFTNGFGMYRSPYYYGHYPRYYRSYTTVPSRSYKNRAKSSYGNSSFKRGSNGKSSISSKNPNRGKTASKGIKQTLKNPTRTQKSFQKRNPSKRARSGGFGRSKRSGSVRGSSSSRSRSSFGGGK